MRFGAYRGTGKTLAAVICAVHTDGRHLAGHRGGILFVCQCPSDWGAIGTPKDTHGGYPQAPCQSP